MDIFDTKGIKPMLIAEMKEPFDSDDFLYEIKFDGVRCIAYLDSDFIDLKNKRNKSILPLIPELKEINKQVKCKCILDGELVVFINGKPNFYEMQKRTIMSGGFKSELAAAKHPVSFVVYDFIYYDNELITHLPLIQRKELLNKTVIENDRIIVSRTYESSGIKLFELVKLQELEGVVAKRKDSIYQFDKRSKNWIKFKVMDEDDFIICGYVPKENSMNSLIIGQYNDKGRLIYKGHVTLGVSLKTLFKYPMNRVSKSPFDLVPAGNEYAIWIEPELVCTIQSMPSDKQGLRQPVFKGIRDDKAARDCIIKYK